MISDFNLNEISNGLNWYLIDHFNSFAVIRINEEDKTYTLNIVIDLSNIKNKDIKKRINKIKDLFDNYFGLSNKGIKGQVNSISALVYKGLTEEDLLNINTLCKMMKG